MRRTLAGHFVHHSILGCLASATVKSYVVGRPASARAVQTIDGKHSLVWCFASTDCFTQPQLVWNCSEHLLRCSSQGARRCHRSSCCRCHLWPFLYWMVDLGLSITLIYPLRDIGPLILGNIFSVMYLDQLGYCLQNYTLATRACSHSVTNTHASHEFCVTMIIRIFVFLLLQINTCMRHSYFPLFTVS